MAEITKAKEFGITTGETHVDFKQVMQRVQNVIQKLATAG